MKLTYQSVDGEIIWRSFAAQDEKMVDNEMGRQECSADLSPEQACEVCDWLCRRLYGISIREATA